MLKTSKKLLLDVDHTNNNPLLPSNSKGKQELIRIKKIKERVRLRKFQDVNGMQISCGVIKKKINVLFNVNYNKFAESCNPC